MGVVFFDKQTGALCHIHWSKYTFLCFFILFCLISMLKRGKIKESDHSKLCPKSSIEAQIERIRACTDAALIQ